MNSLDIKPANTQAITEAIAKELREVDLSADSANDLPLDDAYKQQLRDAIFPRYPEFEAQTVSDITELKHEVSRLSDMNKVMVWLVLGVMVMQAIAQTN